MVPELSIYVHQDKIPLEQDLVQRLQAAGQAAVPKALNIALSPDSALSLLDEVEVSLIDDETIADIHVRFMDIPGATDVITFDHGEIHISVETARQQADEFGNSFERELMLYVIHGLLHLAGYEDSSDDDRSRMDRLQEEILQDVWR